MSNVIVDPRRLKGARAFAAVAETGSFRGAADRLGMSVSAVSQAVRDLETDLQVALLIRTTRSVSLTPLGQAFHADLAPALTGLSEAFDAVRGQGAGAARLRFTAPAVLVPLILEAVVAPFCAVNPGVEIEFSASDRMVDVVRDGFDGGFRLGELVALDMIAVRLSPPFPFAVTASPTYIARHGAPTHPKDLAKHRCVQVRSASSGEIYRWEFIHGNRSLSQSVTGGIIVDTTEGNIAAAEAGLGLAYGAAPLFAEGIARGDLVTVLADFMPSSEGAFFYYPKHRQGTPALKTFARFARNRLKISSALAVAPKPHHSGRLRTAPGK